MKRIRIIVMAKAPIPGFAKTRLVPALGIEGAAQLAQRLLIHTIHNAKSARLGKVELCVTPEPNHPIWADLKSTVDIDWEAQTEGDLGHSLAAASKRSLIQGESVLLIGTDCPGLNAERLRHAAKSLETFNAVIVPANDGGYTLLGLNEFHSSVFLGIRWSTESVFTDTIQRIRSLQWRFQMLPPLHDIDEPEDLVWLPESWKSDFPLQTTSI